MDLREMRREYGISQNEAALAVDIPLRTYIRYESDDSYGDKLKRQMILNSIKDKYEITEEKGILTIEQIKNKVMGVFDNLFQGEIEFCYLFGSYAKGLANEKSDVDLYVSSSLSGLRFVGLIEKLRQTLHKKVDVIRSSELENNIELVNEIMKGGIKIYG